MSRCGKTTIYIYVYTCIADAQFCPGYCVDFHFGPRAICDEFRVRVSNLVFVFSFIYFVKSLSHYVLVIYFMINRRFMSNCYLCLNVLSSNHVVSYCSLSLVLIFVHVKCLFILINRVFKSIVFRISCVS